MHLSIQRGEVHITKNVHFGCLIRIFNNSIFSSFLHTCPKNKYLIFNNLVCVSLSNNTANVAALCCFDPVIRKRWEPLAGYVCTVYLTCVLFKIASSFTVIVKFRGMGLP